MLQVSVVIPTFNRESFIEKCVLSVIGQTRKAGEVIVVDDGSSDKTWETLKNLGFKAYCDDKATLKYIYKINGGVSSARNLGIRNAKHEYVALLDSDD